MKKGRTLKSFFFNKSLHIVRGAGGAHRRVYGGDRTIPGKWGRQANPSFQFFADFQKNSIAVPTSSWFPRRQGGGVHMKLRELVEGAGREGGVEC